MNDIIIGGRSPQLKAINGSTGALIWEYKHEQYSNDPILHYAHFNFNNSIIVPDQNSDGVNDFLTINGGNAVAKPNSTVDRYPGVLILFNSKTGAVIAADTMPDRKECYMTPISFTQPGSKEIFILFGTGGETIDGKLYLTTMAELRAKKLSAAKVIATETGHGFIAPPTLVDINKDGYIEINMFYGPELFPELNVAIVLHPGILPMTMFLIFSHLSVKVNGQIVREQWR